MKTLWRSQGFTPCPEDMELSSPLGGEEKVENPAGGVNRMIHTKGGGIGMSNYLTRLY